VDRAQNVAPEIRDQSASSRTHHHSDIRGYSEADHVARGHNRDKDGNYVSPKGKEQSYRRGQPRKRPTKDVQATRVTADSSQFFLRRTTIASGDLRTGGSP
jgi:hypothetical protein